MDHVIPDVERTTGQNDTVARVDIQVVEKRPLAPLFWWRMVTLFFAFSFLVIGASLGCAAVSKFHSARNAVASALTIGTVVSMEFSGLQATNSLLVTACFLIAGIMAIFMIDYCMRPRNLRAGFIGHSTMLIVCMALLLAAVIAETVIWSTRVAKINALDLDGNPISQSIIDQAAASAGVSKALSGFYYVRLTVAFAWIGWWLSFIACAVIFATNMEARQLLQAEKEERQREADLYRSRFGGDTLTGDGSLIHKQGKLGSYGKEKSEGSAEPSSSTTPKAGQIEGITETTRNTGIDEEHHIRN
ncbi:hypothetical protein M413DRAFT_30056 [Hebeloma cylindrosporum]|uniref:Uncharacterized protein n=1 Tax=Hebeloma cylindrosporum TaxID=76867 RepID=A0A0C3C4H9_HEBCY|nr:hypothetical protein M413DRAFT_30056 [Hebeloma cylindrosporum h7]